MTFILTLFDTSEDLSKAETDLLSLVQQLSRQQSSLSEYVKQREEFDSEEQKRLQLERQSRRAEKQRLAELESERQKLEFNKNIKYGAFVFKISTC